MAPVFAFPVSPPCLLEAVLVLLIDEVVEVRRVDGVWNVDVNEVVEARDVMLVLLVVLVVLETSQQSDWQLLILRQLRTRIC